MKIAVMGAGSVGSYYGAMLARAGHAVTLIARPRHVTAIADRGLLFETKAFTEAVPVTATADAAGVAGADIVLFCVKSTDTVAAGRDMRPHLGTDTTVLSLQNGVGNVPVLRQRLPGRRVLAGMVAFNVVGRGEGRFHRATSGDIVIEQDEAETAQALSVLGLKLRASPDIAGVQWGKLLVNLNNALNALSGLTLQEQLAQRPWRLLLADQMAEGLAALKAARVRPVSPTPIPSHLVPHLLRLPDPIFNRLLGRTMKIDPEARSSMSEDLQRRRHTEIDYLQGVIAEIAERHGLPAPLSRRVVALIKRAEADSNGSPRLKPDQIRP